MNERIKELAEQVIGFEARSLSLTFSVSELERFAELVRADEREACAKLLDDFAKTEMVPARNTWRRGVMAAANAVRDKK
jgi:hypothetical protein